MKITTENAYNVLMDRIQCMRDINSVYSLKIRSLSYQIDLCCSSSQSSSSSSSTINQPCGILDENITYLLGDEDGKFTIDEECDDSIENFYELTEDNITIIQEDEFNYQILESWTPPS